MFGSRGESTLCPNKFHELHDPLNRLFGNQALKVIETLEERVLAPYLFRVRQAADDTEFQDYVKTTREEGEELGAPRAIVHRGSECELLGLPGIHGAVDFLGTCRSLGFPSVRIGDGAKKLLDHITVPLHFLCWFFCSKRSWRLMQLLLSYYHTPSHRPTNQCA